MTTTGATTSGAGTGAQAADGGARPTIGGQLLGGQEPTPWLRAVAAAGAAAPLLGLWAWSLENLLRALLGMLRADLGDLALLAGVWLPQALAVVAAGVVLGAGRRAVALRAVLALPAALAAVQALAWSLRLVPGWVRPAAVDALQVAVLAVPVVVALTGLVLGARRASLVVGVGAALGALAGRVPGVELLALPDESYAFQPTTWTPLLVVLAVALVAGVRPSRT